MFLQRGAKIFGIGGLVNVNKKIGIVGAGKRYFEFYKDVIDALDLEVVGFVTKSGKISNDVGNYPVFRTMRELYEHDEPDFFISIVPYQVTPSVILEACSLECDILVETPVGSMSVRDNILNRVWESAILAGVVEQWPFLPMECFKKKFIDAGFLGDVYMVENDHRSYNYHGIAQLRNYVGKGANVSNVIASIQENYPLNGRDDCWNIILAKFDNGKTLLFKNSDLGKREFAKGVRGNLALRVYGSIGTIVSGCFVDDPIQTFSIIWKDGEKYDLKIDVEYVDSVISKISTVMPDKSVFSWENKFKEFSFNETQIGIAQHIDGMMNENVLWTLDDGFKDMSVGNSNWV